MGCDRVQTISDVEEEFYKIGEKDSEYVELNKVNQNIWIHTTYVEYGGSRVSANGLVVRTSDGLVLIDTPWTVKQTEKLMDLTAEIFGEKFIKGIVTHAHSDTIGGIDALLQNDIEVISTEMTAKEAKKNGFSESKAEIEDEWNIEIGKIRLEVYYPGEGHAPDNIVVWFPEKKVLFGGCLIKSIDAKNLGSTTDANVDEWPKSVSKVIDKFSDAKIVIPGHGDMGNKGLLEHTAELLQNNK